MTYSAIEGRYHAYGSDAYGGCQPVTRTTTAYPYKWQQYNTETHYKSYE
jgi:hypothetical protein